MPRPALLHFPAGCFVALLMVLAPMAVQAQPLVESVPRAVIEGFGETYPVDALSRTAYQARYEVEHTNGVLIDALHDAGVAIYLCGQTAMHRGLPPVDLAADVDLAL